MNKDKIEFTRRGLVLGSLALMAAGCTSTVRPTTVAYSPALMAPTPMNPRYLRQRVPYDRGETAGTIVVDTLDRFLYFVEEDGWATRYGVGVAEAGLALKGRATVGRKAEWPSWTPTANMMERKPRLVQFAGGVPGGPDNPLGARALYLYRGGRDTMYRLHGTNEPWSIGQAASSGCVRLLNDDIIHLYDRTEVGATVVVV